MKKKPAALLSLLLALALTALGAAIAAAQEAPKDAPEAAAPPAAAYAGEEACAGCHDEVAQSFERSVHGHTSVANWDGATACESCHGPGAEHAADGDVAKIRILKALPPAEQSATCLSCHDRGNHVRWQGSSHESRNLSCLTCHKIHHPGDQPPALLAQGTEFDTCSSCHLKRKAVLMRSSHMPLREGRMNCSSCHNVHGSPGPALLFQSSVNENCYSCHAEKRSPVLWEHPPVKENCLNCHDPHGSVHPRMQIAKQPRLCQQCHDEARHPTQPYSDATTAPEFFPNSRMFDRGCMNCHSQIHGSNHPAGQRFLR